MKTLLIKRNYKMLLAFIAIIIFFIYALGNVRIIAYTNKQQIDNEICTTCYDNTIDIFDDSIVHEIKILTDDNTYDTLIDVFKETQEKEYVKVDVIIDGITVENVGLRVKGNASLRNVLGVSMGNGDMGNFAPKAFGQDFELPEGFEPPTNMQNNMPTGTGSFEDQMPFNQMNGGKEDIPYLLKFDEFVEGQCYEGYSEIAIRTSGVSEDASMLQEPITNYAMNSVGIPASKTSYASIQLTEDSDPIMYTLAEQVDQLYIDKLFPDSDGVLYKINQVGNSFEYLGDDPTLYADIFEQKTNINDADMTPLIKFMKFVTTATDEEFAKDLDKYFDVTAFADYLAIHNLLANNDSLAGMGNNYYLYYDFDTGKFTTLSWDTNESLGKLSGMGGGGEKSGSGSNNGATTNVYWENSGDFGKFFEEQEAENTLVEDKDKGGKMGMGSHILKTRFFETPEFLELYEQRYELLYKKIFVKDLLTQKVEEYSEMITKYNEENKLVDQTEYNKAVQTVLDFIEARYEYLQTIDFLTTFP